MEWRIKEFAELTTEELYEIMKSRFEVFILEQHCMEQDLDDYDKVANHIFCLEDGKVAAYSRLLPAGTKYKEASIGRVLVTKENRKRGLAREMLQESIRYMENTWHDDVIKVQAQAHLENMYGAHGFKTVSEVYEDVGIPHVDMLRHGKNQ